MASPSGLLLTNTNYFSWKSHMEDVLQSKGLYRITLGKGKEPTNAAKKAKWNNKNDEAHGLIGMSISSNLLFHIQGIDDPNKSWDNLNKVFCKHNVIRTQQFENQIIFLSPNDFPFIDDYLYKFKEVRLLLIECEIDMKGD